MQSKIKQAVLAALLLSIWSTSFAQGTAFTYQGRLSDGEAPANGIYDLQFTLFDAMTNGTDVSATLTTPATPISDGLFTVTLDFGPNMFSGESRWLEIGVQTNGGTNFSTLAPRQKLTPTPYAIFAKMADGANLANLVINGSVGPAQLGTPSAPAAGQLLSYNGTNLFWSNASTGGSSVSNAWWLGGNSGTLSGANFLGTTDNQPLELWANNERALRLEPVNDFDHAGVVNQVGGSSVNFIAAGSAGSFIGGGGARGSYGSAYTNSISSDYAVLGGGLGNAIQPGANSSFLGGGLANVISANAAYAVVGGGVGNRASGIGSFIGGGGYDGVNSGANVASGAAATIGGGMGNYATDFYATVAGGIQNSAAGWAAVGGGLLNVASGIGSVVGGGGYDGFNVGPNLASGAASTVGGGWGNQATNFYATASGGIGNAASGEAATIGGGWGNQATNYCATVAGGIQNSAAGWAAVGGGLANSASGIGSFVGGGGYDGVTIAGNAAGGAAAAVVGGWGNNAAGNYSFAAGHQAQALHDGCFVWSDALSAGIQSTAPNQFVIGASGGVQLVGNTGLNVNGAATFNGPIFLANAAAIHGSLAVYDGITVSGAITIYGTLEGADGYFQKVGIDKDLTVLGGATITGKTLAINEMDAVGGLFVRGALPNGWQLQLMNDSAGKPGGGSWGNTSDARIKKNIQPLTGALDKLTQLRGVTYEWINPQDHANQTNVQSGFIAQEVEQVFPDWISQVSPDEHDQALVPDGKVRTLSLPFGYDALVVEAIKEMRAEKDANIAELKSRNQELEQRVLKMETLIQKLTTAHKD